MVRGASASLVTVGFVALVVVERDGFPALHSILAWTIVMASWLVRGSYRPITVTTPDP